MASLSLLVSHSKAPSGLEAGHWRFRLGSGASPPGRAGLVGLPGLPVTRRGRDLARTAPGHRPEGSSVAAHGGGLGPFRRGAASTLALQDVVLRNDPPANRAHSGALRSTWTQPLPGDTALEPSPLSRSLQVETRLTADCMTGPLHENLLGAPEEKANLRRRVVSFGEAGPVETFAV